MAKLRGRMGPELGSVIEQKPLATPGSESWGCAVVYTPVPEEAYGEDLPPDEIHNAKADHALAVALPDANGVVRLHLVPPSDHSPGAVILNIDHRDVTGDEHKELVIQEDSTAAGSPYRGLRVLATAPSDEPPAEVLSIPLTVKTPEGLELIASWKAAKLNGEAAIVLEGGGARRIFVWSAAAGQFEFNEEASRQLSVKPKQAVVPKAPVPPKAPDNGRATDHLDDPDADATQIPLP